MAPKITAVPCLSDNYAYLVHEGDKAWIVDPSEAGPVIEALARLGLGAAGILATHHHPDHVGGLVEGLKARSALASAVVGRVVERRGSIGLVAR